VGDLEASPENVEILDAIFCNLAYIFGIRMASDIIQNGAFAEQKNSSGHDFDSHTHAYTPILPKTSRISATIKFKFNFKNIFSDKVYNVENNSFLKIGEPGGPGPPWIQPCY